MTSIFLSARQMQNVMDGDKAKVRLSGRSVKGRLDGVVVEVLERKHSQLVGRYYQKKTARKKPYCFRYTTENPRIAQDILITTESGLTPAHGQYVLAEIVTYAERGKPAQGVVKKILGDFVAPVCRNRSRHAPL